MPDFIDAVNTGANQIAYMQGVAQANNAWSAGQAQIQREWQEQQNAKAMTFNQNEAAKNRNWQEMLSNTAHQREVRDLMAAGLNPVLSAMNGNGASVGSGATAQGVTSQGAKGDTDTSVNGAIVNLLGSILSTRTQIEAANINARTQEAVAEKYTAMSKIVADIQADASRYGTDKRFTSDMAGIASDAATAALRMANDRGIATARDAALVAAAAARLPDVYTTNYYGPSSSSSNGGSSHGSDRGPHGRLTYTPMYGQYGNGVDRNKQTLYRGSDGRTYYKDFSGKFHLYNK